MANLVARRMVIRQARSVRALTVAALLTVACESGSPSPVSAPAPAVAAAPDPKRAECKALAGLLVGRCPGLDPDLERCVLEPEPFGSHGGGGRMAHFGTAELWFAAPDGNVFADNQAARARCPDLPTVRDYDRARARKAAAKASEGDPTACSLADLAIADVITDHVDVNLLDRHERFGTLPTRGERDEAVAAGIDRAARERGLSRSKVEATWDKVREVCPLALP